MRSILKTLWEHIFITATGIAALQHSTWAIGTMFAGLQPADVPHLIGWIIPAFLLAFSLDVGQIVTSAKIRQSGLSIGKGVTFFVLAGATYYCQWLYMAHHMPALEIGAGISQIAQGTVIYVRDAAIWIFPALLPIATVLYTFSDKHAPSVPAVEAPQIEIYPVKVERVPQVPFGNEVLTLADPESTPTTPKSKKRTAVASSTNGHRKETALRNKEVQNGD